MLPWLLTELLTTNITSGGQHNTSTQEKAPQFVTLPAHSSTLSPEIPTIMNHPHPTFTLIKSINQGIPLNHPAILINQGRLSLEESGLRYSSFSLTNDLSVDLEE
jgi:hypothetical protein